MLGRGKEVREAIGCKNRRLRERMEKGKDREDSKGHEGGRKQKGRGVKKGRKV